MAHESSKKAMSSGAVFGTLGLLVVSVGLMISSIFADKPLSSIFVVVSLALLVIFFVMAYRLGKAVEDTELNDTKAAHPAGAKKSFTFSVLEPPTDPLLNQRYVEGSMWNVVNKDGQRILKRYILTENHWVESPLTERVVTDLDIEAMPTAVAAAKEVHNRISQGDYGKNIL